LRADHTRLLSNAFRRGAAEQRTRMNDIAFVYFDAAGTLLFPQPSVGEVYAAVGRRFGSYRDAAELSRRFHDAFRRQEALDAADGWRTSEARERARWRAIVAEALDDVTDAERCFETLYHHYAQPEAWTCPPETGSVLRELEARGYGLGVASNFDHRLHNIVAGKRELTPIRCVMTSAHARWTKPAAAFFEAAGQIAKIPPTNILFVGDDPRNDYDGPRAAGFTSVLLDASGRRERPDVQRITSLTDLLHWCSPRR
jgi:putative hydrolase of the HAD superfamily